MALQVLDNLVRPVRQGRFPEALTALYRRYREYRQARTRIVAAGMCRICTAQRQMAEGDLCADCTETMRTW